MRVIDSHTGGQPTRLIINGGPDLGSGPLSERLRVFAERFDEFRTMTILEPKCPDSAVGALLCEPSNPDCSAGVIFFNTAGYLGMCGHGTIGVAVSLAYLGRLGAGKHLLETPVGIVDFELHGANEVSFENVESYCFRSDVNIEVDELGAVTGSVAWGGNWFFLADKAPMALRKENIAALTDAAWRIRRTLAARGVTGDDGGEIDHIEFFESVAGGATNSRNFVLCPGGAYDRSPCGTGTSAKMACLAALGKLAPGETWVQESIIGSRFTGVYRTGAETGRIIPTLTGQAHIYADTKLVFQKSDPFRGGIQ